jgi:RecA/RadA recombinase
MGRRKKTDGGAVVDVTSPFGEHPVITEILKAAAEEQDPLIGLPLPALSARYLLQSNIFPLSRFIQLRGEFSAGKSALLIEIMRWFAIYGGGGVMIDTENKGSRSMIDGMFGHNPEYMGRAAVAKADTVEEWQKRYISLCQLIHKQCDANTSGNVYPMCIGVDSISAVEVERRVEKVAEEGHASAGHPYLARNLSDFMRTALVPTLRHYPIAFVATNHLKEEINQMGFGAPKKYAPGGASLDYYPTVIIDMERVSKKLLEKRNGVEGQQVRMIATKNNLGAPGRRIIVNLLWYPKTISYVDQETNETRYKAEQHHFWDWHTATTRLLLDLQDPDRKPQAGHDPKLPDILKQVCDLEYKHGTKNSDVPLVFSTALGISKQDAVPEVEISMLIEENKKISGLLHGLLGINEYAVCDPAVKYREQIMEELRKNQQTDNPELMAATGALEDFMPADLDPLGQFAE